MSKSIESMENPMENETVNEDALKVVVRNEVQRTLADVNTNVAELKEMVL